MFFTHNLALGVFAGIILSAIFFAAKISKVHVKSEVRIEHSKKVYYVRGQLFFASVTELLKNFNFKDEVEQVDIDLTEAHIWDDSAVAAIDKIVIKYRENNVHVNLLGLNEASEKLIDTLAIHKKAGMKLSSH